MSRIVGGSWRGLMLMLLLGDDALGVEGIGVVVEMEAWMEDMEGDRCMQERGCASDGFVCLWPKLLL